MRQTQPRLAPVGLEEGDHYQTPWGELEILDTRGEYEEEDNRQWLVRDVDTDEERWVDWDFLMEMTRANLTVSWNEEQ